MSERRIGLFGATMVGLGGVLGGGIFLLAGTAFESAGPSAILAFALNGAVAWLTAMSVSEMSTAFPESGGAYLFAKKVLSVRAAFAVGWILWFAYIVAGVLYALGFAAFMVELIGGVFDGLGYQHPSWLGGRNFALFLATAATAGYSINLVRKAAGGGKWETLGKVVLFVALIVAGVIAMVRHPIGESMGALDPFFTGGFHGLLTAMGVTFISLQGFEMIAAVAGEIKAPRVTIPKAVFLSLGISLAIYVVTMFLVASAGVEPGTTITELAAANRDTVMAVAAERFLGSAGYWLIVISIILATLSALQANLLTASRVALAMANDHTLPSVLMQRHATRNTPVMAIYATALAVIAIMFMIPDLAGAGAAASLIFLVAYALTHLTGYLARKRSGAKAVENTYRTPGFPLVPLVGGLACGGLAVFQAVIVPDAGGIVGIWLGLGVILYFALFKGRAEAFDASAEAFDPALAKLRGKSPLVLLPIANPAHARSLVEVANAIAPTEYARVLLLAIVRAPRRRGEEALADLASAQDAVSKALTASYQAGHTPEALLTAAPEPWEEIKRIAEEHDCESLLVGLPERREDEGPLEELVNLDCDVAVMRAPAEWRISDAKRVLVAVGGRGEQHELRARLLATLSRESPREIVFVTVVPADADDSTVAETIRNVTRLSALKIPVKPKVQVIRNDDAAGAILEEAKSFDLMILGLRSRHGKKALGPFNRRLAYDAPCAVILLAQRVDATDMMNPIMQPIRDVARSLPWPLWRPDDESA